MSNIHQINVGPVKESHQWRECVALIESILLPRLAMGICLESEEEDTFAGYFFGVGLILIAEDQSIQDEDTEKSLE